MLKILNKKIFTIFLPRRYPHATKLSTTLLKYAVAYRCEASSHSIVSVWLNPAKSSASVQFYSTQKARLKPGIRVSTFGIGSLLSVVLLNSNLNDKSIISCLYKKASPSYTILEKIKSTDLILSAQQSIAG